MSETCSTCGAKYGERCTTCGRELMCGSLSEFCDQDICGRRVMARKYESETRPDDSALTYEQIDQQAARQGRSWQDVMQDAGL